jgi:cyclic beta-1,2-glucan synthetase
VLATDLRNLHPSFLLAQNADDLLLGEPASLHPSVSPQGRGLYSNLEEFSGLRSEPIAPCADLSLTAYVEWVLGPSRSAFAQFVTTEIDPDTGAVFARNPWNAAFASRVAVADLAGRQTDWTGDRREFIGRNGTLENPAALGGMAPLSNKVGAGLDPCGALRRSVALPPNAHVAIVVVLDEAGSAQDASALIARYRKADLDEVLSEDRRHWDAVLGAVQVETPDRAMDIMLNGWLLYQTLACGVA